MDAQRFFEVAIPAAVVRDVERFLCMHGSIAIKVRGVGAWTLRLGNVDQPVSEGFDARAELKLWFTERGFDRFASGDGKAGRMIYDREVAFDGDRNLLQDLGLLLTPTDSPLGTRLAGF
jgi:hypothetical protein